MTSSKTLLIILFLRITFCPIVLAENELSNRIHHKPHSSKLFINKAYDLNGEEIFLPVNTIIDFGPDGQVFNGTLIGQGNRITHAGKNKIGVLMKGSWHISSIEDTFFDNKYLDDEQILYNINSLQSDEIPQKVHLNKTSYNVNIDKTGGAGIIISSNTVFDFTNTTLRLIPNSYKSYDIILVKGKDNVTLIGGKIIGDVGAHTYIDGTTSEWGNGITINESHNITLRNIYISKCTGDGIYVTGGYSNKVGDFSYSSNTIIIDHVICDDNRRQGLSIIQVDGIQICNSKFINTGATESTNPSAGIDIEPNKVKGKDEYMSVRNITISKCILKGNKGYQLTSNKYYCIDSIENFQNIKVEDCDIYGETYIAVPNETFIDCRLQSVKIRGGLYPISGVSFINCKIADGYGLFVYLSAATNDMGERIGGVVNCITLNNCEISAQERLSDRMVKGLISFHGGVGSVENVICNQCKLYIPRSVSSSYFLTKNVDNILFNNCTIEMPGRQLRTSGLTFNSCTIYAGKVVGAELAKGNIFVSSN